MTTQEIYFDFDRLLAPISEELPCGESRENSQNVELARAFSVLLAEWQAAKKLEKEWAENQLIFNGSQDVVDRPKWMPIAEKAIDYLGQYSKDGRVLSCLVESAARVAGFAGLRDSLRLTRQLLETYQDRLNPRPESSDDYAPLDSISNNLDRSKTFADAIKQCTLSSLNEYSQISYFQYELARFFDEATMDEAARESAINQGRLTQARFRQIVSKIPADEIREKSGFLNEALDEARGVNRALQTYCSSSEVSISKTIQILETIRSWFDDVAQSFLATETSAAEAGSSGESVGGEVSAVPAIAVATAGVVSGPIASREQALSQLGIVAEYFRKTEPHSPLSYALEQAIRWGKMPLPELLQDVLRNEEVLAEVFRRIGYRPESSENPSEG
jgi:type VI secretion system protein ImpA